MISTPERSAANKQNALKSTGPKSAEGKAVSARNSLKDGLTGAGIVVPDEDAARAAAIAAELHAEHRPRTVHGRAMLDRAALMLVRLDRQGHHELNLVAREVRLAGLSFDQARQDAADELFAAIDTDPVAFDIVRDMPEGIDRLVNGWAELADLDRWTEADLATVDRLTGGSTAATFRHLTRLAAGLIPIAEEANTDVARARAVSCIQEEIAAEIADLQAHRLGLDHAAIARGRDEARAIALFPTTKEAILARRYEAATFRAYDQIMKEFDAVETAEPVDATPTLVKASAPVASFFPAEKVEPSVVPEAPITTGSVVFPVPQTAQEAQPAPKKRPDPEKMLASQKRNRRRGR